MTAGRARQAAFGLLLLAGAVTAATAATAQSERIVAFGDSLTFGVGDSSGTGGYPPRLQALLTTPVLTVTVENLGKSGETTAAGLSRINSLQGTAADSLILMEGTNDTFAEVSTETTISNLVAMVSRARQRGFGPIYLATVPPIGVTSSGNRFNNSIVLSDAIRQAAWQRSWPNPDPHQGLYDEPDLFARLYTSDGIHPNAAGYQVLAQVFAHYLQGVDSLAPVPSFVTPRHASTTAAPNSLLEVVLFDPLAGIDLATSILTLNDTPLATTVTGDTRRAVLQARPGNLAGRPRLGVDVRDLETPPNRRVQTVSQFTVQGTSVLRGDLDRSGRVDGNDLVALGYSFGSRAGDPRYRVAADIDGNGRVDGSDLALLASNFGLSSF